MMLGLIHEVLGVVSLALGAGILWLPKGSSRHVLLGRLYVAAMVSLNLTALCIYRLTGKFNLFHFLALVSLATLLVGFAAVRRRRTMPRWLWRHYQYMCWSYVGLVAAAVNEAWVRVPVLQHVGSSGSPALVSSILLVAIAAVLVRQNQPRMLAPFAARTGDLPAKR